MDKKIILGQFFTKDNLWLKPQIIDFINHSHCTIAYDPFAGEGDLLKATENLPNIKQTIGLDIDKNLNWTINDSLQHIPTINNAIIITNPPYLSNYSAARKGQKTILTKYFKNSSYSDLYLIALDQMLAAQKNVIAIIPETFINSNYQQKNFLHSLTILEESPFNDTENPVLVACFDGISKPASDIKIYKNTAFIDSLQNIEQKRIYPTGKLSVNFNNKSGWLAVRCVDTTNPNQMIKFGTKSDFDYDWDKKIKTSSRLLTLIDLKIPANDRPYFINQCNLTLKQLRISTNDIILSPFKGNMKNGQRRRRLDFMTCRAIIETVYYNFYPNLKQGAIYAKQQALF